MIICIDDTSQFNLEKDYKQDKAFPCLSAVVFPEATLIKWNESYSKIPKGSLIKKTEAENIIEFLANNGAKAFLVGTNFVNISKINIEECKNDYISSANKACKNSPDFARNSVIHHCEILKNLRPPDFVKAMLFIQLIENSIRGILGNTKTFDIKNLESFSWYSDIMSKKIYPIVCHFVHYSINRHSHQLPIDVDHIDRISNFTNVNDSKVFLDTTRILSIFEFKSDDDFPGIKAADCIANFFQRILRGSLKIAKKENLKKIFEMDYNLDFIHFDKDKPYIDVKVKNIEILKFLKH